MKKSVLSVQVNPEETLQCYASGSGALSFCWTKNGVATGRNVTLVDAQEYLASPEGESLRNKGWRAITVYSQVCLVANVKRIDENTLILDDKTYTYSIDPGSLFWQRDRHVTDHSLTLETDCEGETINVRNVNTRAAIRHFLNEEQELTPPVLDWQI